MDRKGWAILATGGIAHQFAGGPTTAVKTNFRTTKLFGSLGLVLVPFIAHVGAPLPPNSIRIDNTSAFPFGAILRGPQNILVQDFPKDRTELDKLGQEVKDGEFEKARKEAEGLSSSEEISYVRAFIDVKTKRANGLLNKLMKQKTLSLADLTYWVTARTLENKGTLLSEVMPSPFSLNKDPNHVEILKPTENPFDRIIERRLKAHHIGVLLESVVTMMYQGAKTDLWEATRLLEDYPMYPINYINLAGELGTSTKEFVGIKGSKPIWIQKPNYKEAISVLLRLKHRFPSYSAAYMNLCINYSLAHETDRLRPTVLAYWKRFGPRDQFYESMAYYGALVHLPRPK